MEQRTEGRTIIEESPLTSSGTSTMTNLETTCKHMETPIHDVDNTMTNPKHVYKVIEDCPMWVAQTSVHKVNEGHIRCVGLLMT